MSIWWKAIEGTDLAQGELLPNCQFPVFCQAAGDPSGISEEQDIREATLIIMTQACDLQNSKVEFVALCPAHTLTELEKDNPKYAKAEKREEIRKGRIAALHMLASPDKPDDNQASLVVDFGHIISLPVAYLNEHAKQLEQRRCLASPFLEHFSQAFARFFMRVGLPSDITKFK